MSSFSVFRAAAIAFIAHIVGVILLAQLVLFVEAFATFVQLRVLFGVKQDEGRALVIVEASIWI